MNTTSAKPRSPSPLGIKIREARQAKQLTQAQLGEAIGASSRSVQFWENSDRRPEFIFIERIVRVLGLSFDDFAEDAEAMV
jgi:transcriptional regulator with XRE-family HTH domain